MKRFIFIVAAIASMAMVAPAHAQERGNSNPAFAAVVVVPSIFLAAEGATMTGFLATTELNFHILNFGPNGWGGVADKLHHGWKITDVDLHRLKVEVDLEKKKVARTGNGNQGQWVVGCIMGSAAGLILASVHKGGGLRWMTQAEYEASMKNPDRSRELTPSQAGWIAGTCGLAAFVYQSL